MADGILPNLSELISTLPVEAVENINGLVMLLKAVGVAAIIYIIYMIGMGILTFRRTKKIGDIEKKVDLIDKKLNKLLKKKG